MRVEEWPLRMIAAGQQTQQLSRAFVELVIAERADDIALRLRIRFQEIRELALQAERNAPLVGQRVEHVDRRLILQQRRVRRRRTDVIACMNDECRAFRLVGRRLQIRREHCRATHRSQRRRRPERTRRKLAVKIIDTEQLDADLRVATPAGSCQRTRSLALARACMPSARSSC
jgi:hypothetical protein